MEIQLIIRAPNQNIEDQVIYCNTDWTVLRLKSHLSEVYPNKPVIQEQKLIYCGHLLHNHLQLKDVIKEEDIQARVQILHLVWNGVASLQDQIPSQEWPNQPTPVQLSQSNESNTVMPENVLRQRHSSNAPQTNVYQVPLQQIPPANTVPMYFNDPQMSAQMAAMQQMYAQYVSQYWQSMSGVAGNIHTVPVVTYNQPIQNNPQEPAQQLPNQQNNVPAVQIEENEFINRDWLDLLFVYLRFLILLCIVYFYTTPERFMFVIIAVVVAFLYHEGWFMRQGFAEAVLGHRNRGQAEQNPIAANNANDLPENNGNDLPASNENEDQDAHELEAAMDGEEPPHAPNLGAANNNNNQVFSPLTFLATFFSSLIPETPPPVNIN